MTSRSVTIALKTSVGIQERWSRQVLNVLQPVPRLKPDMRSDIVIRNFGEANTDAMFYVESLTNQIPTKKTVKDQSRHQLLFMPIILLGGNSCPPPTQPTSHHGTRGIGVYLALNWRCRVGISPCQRRGTSMIVVPIPRG